LRHGYPLGSGIPITLLGWSGGGQIALGAAWYLPGLTGAPVRVISVGGVMADDPGIQRVEQLWHLWGQKDPLAPLGGWLYAGRWPYFANSVWNRALAAGQITLIPLGPFTHNGKGNYFDNQTTLLSGETHLEYVLTRVKGVLVEAGLVPVQRA
jgi:pimeloyl-ACP methyl ester carboxylesterase